MFESSQRIDPATMFPALAAAITALPTPQRGGSALLAAAELRALFALQRRLQAAVLARLASFDDQGMAVVSGAASTAAWVRAYTNATAPAATSLVAAARTTTTLPLLSAELAAGRIGVEHLQAVARATKDVPDDVLARHDKTLRDAAPHVTPADLHRAGERITEAWDAAAAADDVDHVQDTRKLSLSQILHGVWALDGTLTPEAGTKLAAALEPLMAKRGAEDDRTPGQRRADALLELVEIALRSGDLPDCGGDRTRITLVVHATEAALDLLQDHNIEPARHGTERDGGRSRDIQDGHSCAGDAHAGGFHASDAQDRDVHEGHAQVGDLQAGEVAGDAPADDTPANDTNAMPPGLPGTPGLPAAFVPTPRDPARNRRRPLRSGPGAWLTGGRLAAVFGEGSSFRELLGSHAELTIEALTRLGCDADLALAIMDASGQPLYLSRTSRDPNVAQRRTLVLRDGGCVFPGCQRPPSHCQAHHLKFWTRDEGPTDIDNLALVCGFHHWLVHDKRWTLQVMPVSREAPAGGWTAVSPDGLILTRARRPAA